jgi:hypothetical protein
MTTLARLPISEGTKMKRWFVIAAVLCAGLIDGTAHAGNGTPIDPRSSAVFSWENVVYCDDTTCP